MSRRHKRELRRLAFRARRKAELVEALADARKAGDMKRVSVVIAQLRAIGETKT